VVRRNFGAVGLTGSFGFKHWLIKDHQPRGRPNRSTDFECVRSLDDSDDTLFLVIFRNPLDWLRALHTRPYHAPGHWNLSFSEFIRKPWLACEQSRVNPLWPEGEREYFIEEAENVLRLRSQKVEHLLELEQRVRHVAFVKYETLLEDLGALETVADRFGIPLTNRPLQNESLYFGGGEPTAFTGPKRYPPIVPEDLEFVRQNLDWRLESLIGYEWNDVRRRIGAERTAEADDRL
jgi:hypothetical protein